MEGGKLDEAVTTFEEAEALAPGETEVSEALQHAKSLLGQTR